MKLKSVFAGFLSLVMAAVLLAGCANQMEPAKQAIADIEAAVGAAGPDAAPPDTFARASASCRGPSASHRPSCRGPPLPC